ncbi:MAG: type 1 glutamine amidotransferase [Candidatus Levyibacteriota bacterium]
MKFLLFQHVPHEHPGLIADFAKKNNIELIVIKFWEHYEIPEIVGFDALIIMGGPMGVYEGPDIFPSKVEELAAIRKAMHENIPVLGFCLGSQLLASALGAEVHPNIVDGKKVKEIGYFTINLTKEGQKSPLFQGFEQKTEVLEWHGDAFDLPNGAQLLASSTDCTNQAFSFGKNFGLLFHFEFTPDMVKNQIAVDNKWIHEDYELSEDQLNKHAAEVAEKMKRESEMLLTNFVSVINES